MPKLKPVGQALTEAMQLSKCLEERRGSLGEFDLRRLAHMACPQEGNYQLHLAREMLVAEIERDFKRFDRAAGHFLSQAVSWSLAANMSTIALFSFNPHVSLQLARRALDMQPDSLDLIDFSADCAWFTGDLDLCANLRDRAERLGGEMQKDLRDTEARNILEDAGVPIEHYQGLIHGLHGLLREHFTGAMNSNVELNFDTTHHEDGSSSIVLEVLTDLKDDAFDKLDDAVLEYSSDMDRWGYDLSRVTTLLVRDRPASLAEGAA